MRTQRNRARGMALLAAFGLAVGALTTASAQNKANKTEKIDFSGKPPRGALILFNGKDTSHWVHRGDGRPCEWVVTERGELEVTPGKPDILTKEKFQDYQLHVEFNIPVMPYATSQARGNSGVYNHGLYEIQILDSFTNMTYANGCCGAIYGQKEPDKNVCRPAGKWQTYDIFFTAPRFDADGKATANPRITVYQNGEKIHDNVEITIGATTASLGGPMTPTGPIMLQNHGTKVKFRNIWIKPKMIDLPK